MITAPFGKIDSVLFSDRETFEQAQARRDELSKLNKARENVKSCLSGEEEHLALKTLTEPNLASQGVASVVI